MSQIVPGELWLVRDARNLVWGPVSRKELIELLRQDKLKPKTEISQSQSYWFYIEEKREVLKFLPELSDLIEVEEEATQVSVSTPTKTVPGEWLSEELKEEFGFVVASPGEGTTVALRRGPDAVAPADATAPTINFQPQDEEPTLVPAGDQHTDPTLNVEDGILELQKQNEARRRRLFIGLVTALVIGVGVFSIVETKWKQKSSDAKKLQGGLGISAGSLDEGIARLRVSILIGDLSELQDEINQLERARLSGAIQGSPRLSGILALAKAVMRREFLMDSAGALTALQGLPAELRSDEDIATEADNLAGIYQMEISPEDSLRLLGGAIKRKPQDHTFQLNLAMAYVAANTPDRAVPILQGLVQTVPDGSPLKPYVFLALGQALPKSSDDFLNRALTLDPLFDEARLLLSMDQIRTNRISDAVKNMRMFIDAIPGYQATTEIQNFRLAEVPQTFSAARAEIRATMARINTDDLLLAMDGHLSLLMGETKEAEQAFDRALQKTPGSLYALKGMAYLRLKEGKEIEIENLIKSKAEENRQSLALNVLLGISYMKQGKFRDAESALKPLVETQKAPAFVYSLFGDCMTALGDGKQGIQLYQRALALNPRDLGALRGLAKAGQGASIQWDKFRDLLPF